MSEDNRFFRYRPSDDHPGWYTWNIIDETRFNHAVMGPMLLRVEDGKCRVRMQPERKHSNLQDMIHGAVTLALIDIAMFAGMRTLTDNEGARAVTLELSTQFIGAGRMSEPLDALVEVLHETRRTVFMRGHVEQGEHLVAAYSGLVRKAVG
ncbi:PaaI family thioesterase [Tsuneonella sp. HG249]